MSWAVPSNKGVVRMMVLLMLLAGSKAILGMVMLAFGIVVVRDDENAYSIEGRPGPPLWCELSLSGAFLIAFGVMLLGYLILETG